MSIEAEVAELDGAVRECCDVLQNNPLSTQLPAEGDVSSHILRARSKLLRNHLKALQEVKPLSK